ncbi:MAG: hypothetical protein ABIC82_03510 [bacterium]
MFFKKHKKAKTHKPQKEKNKKEAVVFKSKITAVCASLVVFMLAALFVIELAQFFLQAENFSKKIILNQPRPIYIVDSQPIDIDVYLRQYFANKVPQQVMNVTVSSYTSTVDQTDDTPYITAFGTPIRDGIVAANFLPVGTVIRFPNKFGDKLFVVEDRMNERYSMQVDVWMSDREEAKQFGIQYLKMEVF